MQAELRTFFVTTSTWQSRYLFQSDQLARLLMDVLLHYRDEGKYRLHDFVVMPNHLHLLFKLTQQISVEKAVQFIKGGFSYRAKRELGFAGEVWHRGFSEFRIFGAESYLSRKQYIHQNPVKERLVTTAEGWEYSSAHHRFMLDPIPEYLRA